MKKFNKTILLLSTILTFAIIIIISGCDRDCDISVEGIVTDSISGSPVANLEIFLCEEVHTLGMQGCQDEMKATTDLNGRYFLKKSIKCYHHVHISHVGCLKNGACIYWSQSFPLGKGHNEINIKLKMK